MGISRRDIELLIATGLHRACSNAEIDEMAGDPFLRSEVAFVNHDARAAAQHVKVGTTTLGIEAGLDRRFVDADLKIVTGLVEPHFMAGWSGGRKVVAPGIADADTIRALHSARILESPGATQCNLLNNPLHLQQMEILALLQRLRPGAPIYGLDRLINENRELIHVNFGEIRTAHMQAVQKADEFCTLPMDRKFPAILTSGAGYPLDQTYYQTVKAMVSPMDIAEPNAALIVASQCAEGLGSTEFRRSQLRLLELGPGASLESLRSKPLADIDEWETEIQLRGQNIADVKLCAEGLSHEERRLTGVDCVESLIAAVRQATSRSASPAIAVIPEGASAVPKFVS